MIPIVHDFKFNCWKMGVIPSRERWSLSPAVETLGFGCSLRVWQVFTLIPCTRMVITFSHRKVNILFHTFLNELKMILILGLLKPKVVLRSTSIANALCFKRRTTSHSTRSSIHCQWQTEVKHSIATIGKEYLSFAILFHRFDLIVISFLEAEWKQQLIKVHSKAKVLYCLHSLNLMKDNFYLLCRLGWIR